MICFIGNFQRRQTRSSGPPPLPASAKVPKRASESSLEDTQKTDSDSNQGAVELNCSPHRKINRKKGRPRKDYVSEEEDQPMSETEGVTFLLIISFDNFKVHQ